jgi:regulator of nucleoside diphosphate kinase
MLRKSKICITEYDYTRLLSSIQNQFNKSQDQIPANIRIFIDVLKRAKKVNPHNIPSNYVTMNSIFKLRDLGKSDSRQYQLVFPSEEDPTNGKLSVLTPGGTAVLGYKEGDVIKWDASSGEKFYQIEKIIYQPEANGHYHL